MFVGHSLNGRLPLFFSFALFLLLLNHCPSASRLPYWGLYSIYEDIRSRVLYVSAHVCQTLSHLLQDLNYPVRRITLYSANVFILLSFVCIFFFLFSTFSKAQTYPIYPTNRRALLSKTTQSHHHTMPPSPTIHSFFKPISSPPTNTPSYPGDGFTPTDPSADQSADPLYTPFTPTRTYTQHAIVALTAGSRPVRFQGRVANFRVTYGKSKRVSAAKGWVGMVVHDGTGGIYVGIPLSLPPVYLPCYS